MAARRPTDRIREMVRELERAARTMGGDLRERAEKAVTPPDLEAALRQVLQGLTNITAQIEKAVGELRRYLEANAKAQGGRSKGARRKAAGKASAGKKKATKASGAARKGATKKAATKPAAAKKPAAKKKAAKAAPRPAAS